MLCTDLGWGVKSAQISCGAEEVDAPFLETLALLRATVAGRLLERKSLGF